MASKSTTSRAMSDGQQIQPASKSPSPGHSSRSVEHDRRKNERDVDSWGVVIVVARFFSFCLDIGITKSLGLLIPEMEEQLQVSSSTIGFVTSVTPALTYLGSPLALAILLLANGGNQRIIASCSGLLAGLSLVATFFTNNIRVLSVLFFITGLSCSFINLHGAILAYQYYGRTDQYAFFSAVSVLGLPVGCIILPPITEKLIEAYGYRGTLLVLGGLVLNLFPVCATFKEPRIRHGNASSGEISEHSDTWDPGSEGSLNRDPSMSHTDAASNLDWEVEVPVPSNPECWEDIVSLDSSTEQIQPGTSKPGTSMNTNNPESTEGFHPENSRLLGELPNHGALGTFRTVLKRLHVYFLVEEPEFTFLYVPGLWTLFVATGGWALFNVLYGLSQGLDLAQSALLATSGATGGLVASILVSFILRWRPGWCLQLYLFWLITASIFCFLQTLKANFIYMLMTSFLIGAGLFGANMNLEAALPITVRDDVNIPDATSFRNLVIGLGYLPSGYIAGIVHDYTHSMKAVFMFLGGTLILASCFMATLIGCTHRRDKAHERI